MASLQAALASPFEDFIRSYKKLPKAISDVTDKNRSRGTSKAQRKLKKTRSMDDEKDSSPKTAEEAQDDAYPLLSSCKCG